MPIWTVYVVPEGLSLFCKEAFSISALETAPEHFLKVYTPFITVGALQYDPFVETKGNEIPKVGRVIEALFDVAEQFPFGFVAVT